MSRVLLASLGGALILTGSICIPGGDAIWAHSYKGFGFREGLAVAQTVKAIGIAMCAAGVGILIKAVWKKRRPRS